MRCQACSISNSKSPDQGGGFRTGGRLQVTNSSVVSLQNVTAGTVMEEVSLPFGGVEIVGNSTINISNSRAEAENGGGFDTENGLKVSTGSRIVIRNATAGGAWRRILCQREGW